MNTTLSHLPPTKRAQLQAITQVIVRAAHPEKIILFGTHAEKTSSQVPAHMASFDILIITRENDRRYDYQFQDLIENRCHARIPGLTPSTIRVTIIVHDIGYVNKSLAEGQPFFYHVLTDGILLHDAGAPLANPATPDFASIVAIARKDYYRLSRQSRMFLDSALFNEQRQEYNIAAFLLHQAAENAYQAILLVFTGYKPCTHNLDKLRRYTNRFSIELAALFPRDDRREDELFKLLVHAYVDARYDREYKISGEEVLLLLQRILCLRSISDRICRNHFTLLEKRVGEPARP